MAAELIVGIDYTGIRGDSFKSMWKRLLQESKLSEKLVKQLTSPIAMSYVSTACTHSSYDSENNYEFFKSLGIVSFHKILIWYLSKKFPEMGDTLEGKDTLTKLRNNMMGELCLVQIAKTYNIWDYISIVRPVPTHTENEVLHEVMVSLFAIIEMIVNRETPPGRIELGFTVANMVACHLLGDVNVDTINLQDPKTRLKEVFDPYKKNIDIVYESTEDNGMFTVTVYKASRLTDERELLGSGQARKTIIAEKLAAKEALEKLGISLQPEKRDRKKKPVGIVGPIHYAPRDDSFTSFIETILRRVYFLEEVSLTQEEMKCFAKACTNPTADEIDNYEYLETLGDTTVNKSSLWYISNRFSQINTPECKDILTKLKITFINTNSLAALTEKLQLDKYVSCAQSILSKPELRVKVLEDVLEAFFAAVEMVMDKKYKDGIGYITCYYLFSQLMNSEDIKIDYTKIAGPITILKEIFDHYQSRHIGTHSYYMDTVKGVIKLNHFFSGQGDTEKESIQHAYAAATLFFDHMRIPESIRKRYKYFPKHEKGYAFSGIVSYCIAEMETKKDAAQAGIDYFKSLNIYKQIPKQYIKFCV